jgi:hypothetical protein
METTSISAGELIQLRFKTIYHYTDKLTSQQHHYKQRYCHVEYCYTFWEASE